MVNAAHGRFQFEMLHHRYELLVHLRKFQRMMKFQRYSSHSTAELFTPLVVEVWSVSASASFDFITIACISCSLVEQIFKD
jgi:hypothetical protein